MRDGKARRRSDETGSAALNGRFPRIDSTENYPRTEMERRPRAVNLDRDAPPDDALDHVMDSLPALRQTSPPMTGKRSHRAPYNLRI